MANTTLTYGNWEEIPAPGDKGFGHARMDFTSRQLLQSWQRCSLVADFWARYIALSSSEFEVDHPVQTGALEGALSFILNELLENAAKFNSGPVDELTLAFWLFPEQIKFQVTNHIEPGRQDGFVRLIDELLGDDPQALYFKRLNEGLEGGQQGSGLGYLTLINDYKVSFGFRFRPLSEQSVAVDVQAHISVSEILSGI